MRISIYDLNPGKLELHRKSQWFLYAPAGGVEVTIANDFFMLQKDTGVLVENGAQLALSSPAWLYEVASRTTPFLEGAEIQRSHPIAPDFPPPFVIRADRIESEPGGATPRHGHRGPGMRRLVFGRLLAEIGDTFERLEAGDSWFETGKDMVVGTNLGPTNAAFVRVMVLPVELEGGKSSFIPENAAEAARPRAVKNRLFGEIRCNGFAQGDGK